MKRRGGRPVISGLAVVLAGLLAAAEWRYRAAAAAASGGPGLADALTLARPLLWAMAALAAIALGWLWRLAGGAAAPVEETVASGDGGAAGRDGPSDPVGAGGAADGAGAAAVGAAADAPPAADGSLERLVSHLQSRREVERHRLARELHDELGALLTAAKLDAARVRSRLPQPVLPEVLDRLRHMDEALNQAIALKRRVIEDLHPSSLDNLGLPAALEILVGEFGERTGVQADMDLEPVELARDTQLTVFRLVQEALDNVERHAQAARVRVTLAPEGDRARLRISDDGIGFAAGQPDLRTPGLLALGLRVRAEGGSLQVTSAANAGTTVEVALPLRQPA